MPMTTAKTSEKTAITSGVRLRLEGLGTALGNSFWFSTGCLAAAGVCFSTTGADAQRRYTSRMSSAPFGPGEVRQLPCEIGNGMVSLRCNPLRGEKTERRRDGLSGRQRMERAGQALHGLSSAEAEPCADLDGSLCGQKYVGRVGRWQLFSTRGNQRRTGSFQNRNRLEPGHRNVARHHCFQRHRIRSLDVAEWRAERRNRCISADLPGEDRPRNVGIGVLSTDAAGNVRPCIETGDSASNSARGSSDPAAARLIGFKIGSAIYWTVKR